jgi:hypothetical protein
MDPNHICNPQVMILRDNFKIDAMLIAIVRGNLKEAWLTFHGLMQLVKSAADPFMEACMAQNKRIIMNQQSPIGRDCFNDALQRGSLDKSRKNVDTPVGQKINVIPQLHE